MAIRAFSSSSFLRHYRDDVKDLAAWRLFNGIDPAAEAVSRMLEPAKIDPVGGVPLPIRLVASSPAHDFHAIEVAELRVRLSRMVNDSVPALPDKVVDGLTQLIHIREYAIVRATTRAHRSYAVYMTYYVNLAYASRLSPVPSGRSKDASSLTQFQTTMSLTTSPVSKEICDRLKRLASNGETYDDRLIEDAEARSCASGKSASSRPRSLFPRGRGAHEVHPGRDMMESIP